jgi:hypothetical protein
MVLRPNADEIINGEHVVAAEHVRAHSGGRWRALCRAWRQVLTFALSLGCATPSPAQLPSALTELHAADRAVGLVGARLAAAGSDLCKTRVATLGLVLDDAGRYATPWRDAAEKLVGSASAPAIIALVHGGAAQRAGVQVGDAITGIDGWTISPARNVNRSEVVLDRIERVPPPRPQVLHIARAGEALSLRVVPDWTCRTRFQVLADGQLQAKANGTRVEIGSELVRVVHGDDELAVILAHELAHNILDHRARLAAAGVFRGRRSQTEGARLTYATEIEADRLAVYLSERAGFNLAAFGTVWARLGAGGGANHPPNARRSALLAGEIARVKEDRAAGRTPRPLGLDPYLRLTD